jgi:hypothetical protein
MGIADCPTYQLYSLLYPLEGVESNSWSDLSSVLSSWTPLSDLPINLPCMYTWQDGNGA